METKKTDPTAAVVIFEKVRSEHPGYVPNYYHLAKTLEELGEAPRAENVYRQGLDAAKAANDMHAYGELEAELDKFG
jgi:hypothetical protein